MFFVQQMKEQLYFLKRWYRQVFLYPPLREMDTSYDTYWKERKQGEWGGLNAWQKERADFIIKIVDEKSVPVNVVDVGCGDGVVLAYIREHIKTGEVVGIDTSPDALKEAVKHHIKTLLKKEGEPEPIPKTDYVLLLEVLEHIPDSETLLKEAYARAKKGVFFSFPNSGYFIFRLRLLFGRFPMQWRVHPGEHVRFWTRKDLIWWLKALGFKNYTIHTYQGVPILNKIWPAMFGAGFIVFLQK